MGSYVSNGIIILILLVAGFFAVKSSIAHFKGEGACCGGGGGKLKRIKPQKLDSVIAVKTIRIEGMMCDHCAARIHNALNSLDGVNAKVIRSRDKAVVRLGKEIDEEKLRELITELGYTVVSIE